MAQIISLWTFSCNLYHKDQVQDACHFLQDHEGVDVPLLLFYCWMGTYHMTLSLDQRYRAQQSSLVWQQHCIKPLRHIRQTMKTIQAEADQQSTWQQVREEVKSLELSAEKQVIEVLESQVKDLISSDIGQLETSSAIELDQFISHAIANIDGGFPKLARQGKTMEAIATILHAICPEMQYDSVFETMKRIRAK